MDVTLGAVKNRFEFAEALRDLGWETELFGFAELGLSTQGNTLAYREALRDFIVARGVHFNVVLYEYDTLPFPRSLFPERLLLVARPALLNFHYHGAMYPLPTWVKLKDLIGATLNRDAIRRRRREKAANIHLSLSCADLIQVQNRMDASAVKERYPQAAVAIVPNGLSAARIASLALPLRDKPLVARPSQIAFVGTFDYRKGALDMRQILSELVRKGFDCRLKLIGTKALFQSTDQVLQFFPRALRHRITVVETFIPDALPNLLSDCRVGLFPSYWESFGFGALEMMAAGLPVVAYASPGPADFVPQALQVSPGDTSAAVALLGRLLQDGAFLDDQSISSIRAAAGYTWLKSADVASKGYAELLAK